MNILGDPEKKAELARIKYGARTINEILSKIIILTIIGYIVIALIVSLIFFSPIDERFLTSILLVFVLAEMLTEYALWAFTYQGMRKTEGPLQDLQKFSAITKEGWKRAEVVFDLTTPFFKWLEDLRERIWPDWREDKAKGKEATPAPIDRTAQVMLSEISNKLKELENELKQVKKDNHRKPMMDGTGIVDWGTENLKD